MPEPSRRSTDLALRVAGVAAVAGGLCWTVKAGVILFTGNQPAHLFELAPAAQGVALASLAFSPASGGGRLSRLGGVSAAALGVGAAVVHAVVPRDLAANVTFFLGNLAVVAGAFLVGRAVRRHRGLGRRSGVLRGIGLWTLPALVAGGVLAQSSDRLLEVPILALGLAWTLVGALCLVHAGPSRRPRSAGNPQGTYARRRTNAYVLRVRTGVRAEREGTAAVEEADGGRAAGAGARGAAGTDARRRILQRPNRRGPHGRRPARGQG